MTEILGNNFFFDWEIRLMEWLQSAVGSEGPLLSILSSLSAFGEQLLLVLVMGFLYWGWNKEFGKYVGVNVLVASVWNPMIKNIARPRAIPSPAATPPAPCPSTAPWPPTKRRTGSSGCWPFCCRCWWAFPGW